jgi:mRNA-degrading endonuclease RelE of RelBE toxin-antitoxin system
LKIKYSEAAFNDLKSFNVVDRRIIAEKIKYLSENFNELKKSKKVTQLKESKFPDQFRFVISRKIRALFMIENDELILLILRIGKRKKHL